MHQETLLIGRIAQPEIRTAKSGATVLSFGLATTSGNGESQTTEWFNCSIVGKFADTMKDKLQKGQLVFAKTHASTSKGNNGVSYTTHFVDTLRILANSQGSAAQAASAQAEQNYGEIPF